MRIDNEVDAHMCGVILPEMEQQEMAADRMANRGSLNVLPMTHGNPVAINRSNDYPLWSTCEVKALMGKYLAPVMGEDIVYSH